jgi:hypothetical protein
MKKLVLLISIFILGCTSKSDNLKTSKTLNMEINFHPSFIGSSNVRITSVDTVNYLTLTIRKPSWEESIDTVVTSKKKIEAKDYDNLIKSITAFDSCNYKQKEVFGLDGITINASYSISDSSKLVNVWSPNRNDDEIFYNNFIDPIFILLNKYFTKEVEVNYIEKLEQYFDFGFPLKTLSNDPKIYKLYGGLSYFKETEISLNNFIDSFPTEQPVIIDMSNFQRMGSIFYPHFRRLLTKNDKIKWVAIEIDQLADIGVKKENIFKNREQAMKSLK